MIYGVVFVGGGYVWSVCDVSVTGGVYVRRGEGSVEYVRVYYTVLYYCCTNLILE